MRAVGDLEILNDTELKTVREVLKTYDKTANVLGHYQQEQTINTGKANRAYHHIKNFQHTNIPNTVQELQDIERYFY